MRIHPCTSFQLLFWSVALLLVPMSIRAQLYQDEITTGFLASRTIDVQQVVGAVAGTAGVSASGAAQYTIPIYVAPGTNGMQPQLGIVYSSHGGDGPLGWGWGLSGLSSITRTGTDWYHEAGSPSVRGVTFTSADRFVADGSRLVLTAGDYGASGSTYDTEDAAFSVYTAHGVAGSGPSWFSVTTRAGMYLEFGATPDARIMADNGNSVFAWRLNKAMDPNGNYCLYYYDLVDGESLLKRIEYTGNDAAGISPYNKVEFTYASRADRNEVFIRGLGGPKTSNLLTHIDVRCEGSLFKVYKLNYSLRDLNKSYLREVGEYAADGATGYNTMVIKYNEFVAAPFVTEYSSAVEGSGHDFYSGDYNGDGDSELLTSGYFYTEDGFRYNTNLQVFARTGASTLSQTWSTTLNPNIQVIRDC